MRIAIIIPVHNVTDYLEEALKSAIAQVYPEQEIIVVDDGSAPIHAAEISAICKRYPSVRLMRRSHRGAAAARDLGWSHSKADFIVFLDADDVLLPGTLYYFEEAFRCRPHADAVYARVVNINEAGKRISGTLPAPSWIGSGPQVLELLLERKIPFCNGSICMRKSALQALSVHNYHLTVGEDWVLWCHLALKGNIISAGDRVVLHRRKHRNNVSSASLNDPDLIMAAYRSIFTHPAFAVAVGEEKLHMLQEKCISRIYAYLAGAYAANSQPEQAKLYLEKINIPLSELVD